MVNYGNANFLQTDPQYEPAPFGDVSFGKGTQTRDAQLSDGLSNTVLMSEIVMAQSDTDNDVRGSILNNTAGGCQFMTKDTPNAGVDRCICMGPASASYPGPCVNTPAQDGRMQLNGRVTFDGRPVEQGTISFLPADGKGPTAGALIENGRYTVRAAPGKKKVEIEAYRVIGQQHAFPDDPSSPTVAKTEPIIPAKYNTETELEVDVAASSKDVNFALQR